MQAVENIIVPIATTEDAKEDEEDVVEPSILGVLNEN